MYDITLLSSEGQKGSGVSIDTAYEDALFQSVEDINELMHMLLNRLTTFTDKDTVHDWYIELINSDKDLADRDQLLQWYKDIRRKLEPSLEGYSRCPQKLTLLHCPDSSMLPLGGNFSSCDSSCTRCGPLHEREPQTTNFVLSHHIYSS